MNASSNTPSDSDREFLQAELTRLVGQGRLDLDTYQNIVDTVWSTDDMGELVRIRARFLGGPQFQHPGTSQGHRPPPHPEQQQAPGYQQGHQQSHQQDHQHFGQPAYNPNFPGQQPQHFPPQQQHPQQPQQPHPGYYPMQQPPTQPGQYQPSPHGGIPMGGQPAQPVNGQYPREPETSTMGSIRKTGEWLVPAYSEYRLNGADLYLDIRHATAAAPVITFDVNMTMAAMTVIVPPGVHVDVQMTAKNWSDFKIDTSTPIPGAPRVIITGVSRASGLKVFTRSPHERIGFWKQMGM
ncbi:hypothetical protein CDES_10195 [Corynebacterium deserti GIMN1.010]|uniref:DUF1707 domain-containing protein n=1 Tax=Corynebacterium deserti GIMN1.010 TaxID=931089 RepID=A0A0M4CZ10_9CORY|nr:DUF1707 domain-containing protein [Corynebacterium deserti]ALC06420.1 hypothetical protein CDES_10195 [Corynebacterium deserti GIMN1.010]